MKNRKNRLLFLIIFLGLLARVIFTLFVAEHYFGRQNVYVDGDTAAWTDAIKNLIEHGTYTSHPGTEYGYFGRTPGYSFFIGIFYLLTGGNYEIMYPLIGWVQILLDTLAIYFVFSIAIKIFNNRSTSLIAAGLYAFYPFIIVWAPVVYSESISMFSLILAFWFLVGQRKYRFFWSGALLSFAFLCRPQLMLMAPVFLLYILIEYWPFLQSAIKYGLQFTLMVLLVYAPWPIRNYVNHGKIIPTQDLRGAANWDEDVMAFWRYIYSVKAEWDPQFTQIIQNKEVTFPENAYTSYQDSLKLEKVILLSKNCGKGFSHWKGYWKDHVTDEEACNEEIVKIYDELRRKQIKEHPLNFYVKIPLQNLKKALFKTALKDTSTFIRKLASLLFYYRSFLLVLGFIGSVVMIRNGMNAGWLILLYAVFLYLALCFGTGAQFRNIEMRYFLPADVLLLFPGAFIGHQILRYFNPKIR